MPRKNIRNWNIHMNRKLSQPSVDRPNMSLCVSSQRRGKGYHQCLDRLGSEIGLHAVPDDPDDAAQNGGKVCTHDAEGHARHNRERECRISATAGR